MVRCAVDLPLIRKSSCHPSIMNPLSLVATGDSFITRRIPANDPGFAEVASIIQAADARFTNLETVLRRDEGFPAAQSGGTWASSPPGVLEDLLAYGFNLVAWANNHTMDYSHGGLESTVWHLDQAGLVHAGAGATLAEAAAIRYLETPGGRVALIAATSTFHESWIAGEQRKDGPGRPGIHPLRFSTIYEVTSGQLGQLKAIADVCHVNAAHELRMKEGFSPADPEGVVRFGNLQFRESKTGKDGEITLPHRGDLQRISGAVAEASRQADIVLVSIHGHEGQPGRKDLPADFLVAACREFIDAGAHTILCHGPHVVRGVEVYKSRPIFHGLGNFIFQNEGVAWQPADFYEKYGLDPSLTVSELFVARSANGTRGLGINPRVWESVIASWKMESGQLQEIVLDPISLGFGEPPHRMGVPRLTDNLSGLENIIELSKPFSTEFQVENGRAIWRR